MFTPYTVPADTQQTVHRYTPAFLEEIRLLAFALQLLLDKIVVDTSTTIVQHHQHHQHYQHRRQLLLQVAPLQQHSMGMWLKTVAEVKENRRLSSNEVQKW